MISNIGWCVWHRGDRPEHQFKHSLPSHPGARLDMRSYSILFFQCALCLTFPFQPWTFGFAVCRANCFLMEVRISCWCLRSYTLSYFFGGWFPPSLEGGCSGVHKHSMVAFPHIYPLICKYLEGGSGGLHEHSLPASSWQDSRSQCSLVRPQKGFTFFSFPLSVSMIQGHGGTTRIKFLLLFLWIFHITLCAPIIIGLVRSSFHIFKVLLAIIQIILIFIYIDISQVEAWPFPKRYSCQVHFHFSTNHFLYDLILWNYWKHFLGDVRAGGLLWRSHIGSLLHPSLGRLHRSRHYVV